MNIALISVMFLVDINQSLNDNATFCYARIFLFLHHIFHVCSLIFLK